MMERIFQVYNCSMFKVIKTMEKALDIPLINFMKGKI